MKDIIVPLGIFLILAGFFLVSAGTLLSPGGKQENIRGGAVAVHRAHTTSLVSITL